MMKERPQLLENNVVMVINQQGKWVQQQKEPFHQLLEREILQQ